MQRECLSAEEIAIFVAGGTPTADVTSYEQHVDSCEPCRLTISAAVRTNRTGTASARGPLVEGAMVGRYVVIGAIGAGGMGVVYAAHDPQLGRKIALKLLRAEHVGDLAAARARLEREARALALLSHPNVVTVHDIATHGDEIFIAMELVEGTTLRGWLEQTRTVDEIVAVFSDAARGLAAAHATGLVHRDFKPENVLVGTDDRVVVSDFGLARVADDDAELDSRAGNGADHRLTAHGAIVGTIAYMAPEQLRGEAADARTDQFSFAVALHEALHGQRPFTSSSVDERRAVFDRGEPPLRGANARVPSWLREVVIRGLALDSYQRWPSMEAVVTALARDPRRTRRRIIGAVGVATLVVLSAIAFVVRPSSEASVCRGAGARLAGVWDDATKQTIRDAFVATRAPFAVDAWSATEHALDRYTAEWVDAETTACEATRVHGTQSEALLDLRMECLDQRLAAVDSLTQVFAKADRGVVEAAPRAAQQVAQLAACADQAALVAPVRPPADPVIRASVEILRTRLATASALRSAGKLDEAAAIAGPAVTTAEELGYAPATAEALLLRGMLEADRQNAAAEKTLARATDMAEAGASDVVKAEAWTQLVRAAAQKAHYAEAHDHAAHASAVLARLGSGHDATVARVANYDGGAYMGAGDYAHALELQQRALAIRDRIYGGDGPEVATVLNSIGNVEFNLSHNKDAKAAHERALAIRRRVLGPHHPDVAASDNNLSAVLIALGDLDGALARLEEARTIDDEVYGPTSSRSAQVLGNIANLYKDQGRYADGLAAATRAVAMQEQALGPDHPLVATLWYVIGTCDLELHDYAKADAAFSRALEIRQTKLGDDHPETLVARRSLGALALARGDARKARSIFEQVLAAQQAKQGPDADDVGGTHGQLGTALRALGDSRGALAHFERELAIDEKNDGPDHGDLVIDLTEIGATKLELGDTTGALVVLERALAIGAKAKDTEPAARAESEITTARALWQANGDRARARTLAHDAETILSAIPAKSHELAEVDRWLAAHIQPQ